jgi:glyoxylase-like metal-dependent hydrolase (beta-lactamase superfamily II)
MQQIVPGLSTFSGLIAGRVYAIEDPDGFTIIDASISGAANKIIAQIQALGRQASDIKRILITHGHPDHVGDLARLKQMTSAQVMCHALEKPVIQGEQPIVRRPSGLRPPNTFIKPPTQVDRVLDDGDVLPEVMGGLQVVFTPGHAPGHLSFWHPEKRILFCGDVIFHTFGLRLPLPMLTVDMDEDKRSIAKLVALEPSVVCFGHGQPITENAAAQIRGFAQRVGAI